MHKRLKTWVGTVAYEMGYHIQKTRDNRTSTLLSALGVDLIIDVGANKGQYAIARRESGYKGEILSFEPQSAAHAKLLTLSQGDSKWMIAERMAIGDRSDEVEINLAANSVSSSVLPMMGNMADAAPQARYIGKETVPLRRLDDVLESRIRGKRVFLKLDVQGFERCVLSGAERVLAKSLALQLEMSLLPLYQGETPMPEMHQYLLAKGFELWDLLPGFRDPKSGRLLEVDGVFTRCMSERNTISA
jgi:FkbM family methyltransferase